MGISAKSSFSRLVRTRRLGYLRVATLEADVQRVHRTPAHLVDASAAHVALTIPVDGTAHVSQDGRASRVQPGELFLVETDRPFTLVHDRPMRIHVFHVPRRALGVAERDIHAVTATAFRSDSGVAAMFAPILTSLAGSPGPLAPAVGERLAGNVTDLLATLILEHTPSRRSGSDTVCGELVPRVREYIDRHLGDPDLSPESIAKAQRISVRYLHRVFEAEGVTVGRLIQRRRLEECGRELARRGRTSPTVAVVAQRWGFVSPAHFSRAFRAVYGMSPREWRERGGGALPVPAAP